MNEFVQWSIVTEVDSKTGRKTTHRVKRIIQEFDPNKRVEIVCEFIYGRFTTKQIKEMKERHR